MTVVAARCTASRSTGPGCVRRTRPPSATACDRSLSSRLTQRLCIIRTSSPAVLTSDGLRLILSSSPDRSLTCAVCHPHCREALGCLRTCHGCARLTVRPIVVVKLQLSARSGVEPRTAQPRVQASIEAAANFFRHTRQLLAVLATPTRVVSAPACQISLARWSQDSPRGPPHPGSPVSLWSQQMNQQSGFSLIRTSVPHWDAPCSVFDIRGA